MRPELELRNAFSGCPPAAMLQAAETGVLPSDLQARVKAHAANCVACGALLRDLAELDGASMRPEVKRRIWRRVRVPWWRRFGVAPLAIGLATAAAVLLVFAPRWIKPPEHAPPVMARIEPQPYRFPLEKPPVLLPPSAVLVWRGEQRPGVLPGKELREALQPYRANDYAEAARRLTTLAEKHPRLAEARFYLGVSDLFLQRNEAAVRELEAARALEEPRLRNHAIWYLALALQANGRDGEALALVKKVCDGGGPHAAAACSALTQIHPR